MEIESILINEIKNRLILEWEYPKELINTNSPIQNCIADIIVFKNNDQPKNPYIIVEIKKDYSKLGIKQLKDYMDVSNAEYGIFYTGKNIVFLRKINNHFEEIVRIPKYGEKILDLEKQIKKDQLKSSFNINNRLNEIYDYLYTNEAFLKETLTNELINLIMMKLVDEKSKRFDTKFWISESEYRCLIENKESKSFINRIQELWTETKTDYPDIFYNKTEISLKPISIAEIVRRLQEISLINTKEDIRNAIFEKLISDNSIRTKGELFTPPSIIELAIKTLNPKYQDNIIDPTCGSGKFLIESVEYIKSENKLKNLDLNNTIVGIDINPELVKLAKINMILFGNDHPKIYNSDSLLPFENIIENMESNEIPYEFNLVFSNPPNNSKIRLNELSKFDLSYKWSFNEQNNLWEKTETLLKQQKLDILFIEKCWQLLQPNGRMGIILPDIILISSSFGYVRQWIINNTRILASISLPIETFMPNTGSKFSFLILQKINKKKLLKINEEGYPIFMGQIEKIGHDRRGNNIFKRDDEGNILKNVEGDSIIDTDIPEIIKCFNEFKKNNNLGF